MKETININAAILSEYNWYRAEAVKSACISNGFDVVSDTRPTYADAIRIIILSKTGIPYNLMLRVGAGYAATSVSIGVGIGQQALNNSSTPITLQNDRYDRFVSGQIHLAYNTNFLLLGVTHYNEVQSYPTYVFSAYIPTLLADIEYPYMVDTGTYGSRLQMYQSDGTTITGVSATTIFNSDGAKFIHPDGKIMLAPLYFNFNGVGSKTVQATLTDAYVSLCKFPTDCPNEFTLDGDDYVRRDWLVFKI